jgi:hypothetical protein
MHHPSCVSFPPHSPTSDLGHSCHTNLSFWLYSNSAYLSITLISATQIENLSEKHPVFVICYGVIDCPNLCALKHLLSQSFWGLGIREQLSWLFSHRLVHEAPVELLIRAASSQDSVEGRSCSQGLSYGCLEALALDALV